MVVWQAIPTNNTRESDASLPIYLALNQISITIYPNILPSYLFTQSQTSQWVVDRRARSSDSFHSKPFSPKLQKSKLYLANAAPDKPSPPISPTNQTTQR